MMDGCVVCRMDVIYDEAIDAKICVHACLCTCLFAFGRACVCMFVSVEKNHTRIHQPTPALYGRRQGSGYETIITLMLLCVIADKGQDTIFSQTSQKTDVASWTCREESGHPTPRTPRDSIGSPRSAGIRRHTPGKLQMLEGVMVHNDEVICRSALLRVCTDVLICAHAHAHVRARTRKEEQEWKDVCQGSCKNLSA